MSETAPGLDFFVREREGEHLLFAAHPASAGITYPMEYDAASKAAAVSLKARFHGQKGAEADLPLSFAAAGSALFRISAGGSVRREKTAFSIERG